MKSVQKIIHQVFWQGLGKVVTSFSTIVTLGLLARVYGQSGTGVYTLYTTYVALFFLFSDLGLNAYFLPELHKSPHLASKLFTFRLGWSLVLMLICNIVAFFLPFSTFEFQMSVLIGSVSILFAGIFSSVAVIFQQKLRYEKSVMATMSGAVVLVGLYFWLTAQQLPIYWLALAPLAGWVVSSLVALILVRQDYRFSLTKVDRSFLQMIAWAWPISLTLVLNVVYFRVDSFILTSFRSFAEVGVYNFAYQFFQTALVLPTFIMNAFYPMMVQSLRDDVKLFRKQIMLGLIGLMILALCGTFITLLSSPILIPLIAGSNDFNSSIALLNVLSLGFPAFFGSALLMWILVTLKQNKRMLAIYFVGLLINIGLNLWTIPEFGPYGAAWSTVISEYIIFLLEALFVYPLLRKLSV